MKDYEFDLLIESYRIKYEDDKERQYSRTQRTERRESIIYKILQHDSEIYRYESHREKEYKRIYNKETRKHPKFLHCECPFAQTIKNQLKEEKKMTPEETQRIKEMPEFSKTDERLIFIRRQGYNDWQNRIFDLSSIGNSIPIQPLKDLKREQVLDHIHFLENCVREMKAYIHGHEKAYKEEVEPEILEKMARDDEEKRVTKKVNKTVKRVKKSDSLDSILASRGIDAKEFMASLLALKMKKEGK